MAIDLDAVAYQARYVYKLETTYCPVPHAVIAWQKGSDIDVYLYNDGYHVERRTNPDVALPMREWPDWLVEFLYRWGYLYIPRQRYAR
jgi:hypothetical protein